MKLQTRKIVLISALAWNWSGKEALDAFARAKGLQPRIGRSMPARSI
jgi:hypothetical protein